MSSFAWGAGAQGAPADRPNILFIYTDDQLHRTVGCYPEAYKYIRTLVEGEIEELYDLESDREELTNLALDSKYASRLESFRRATIAELRRTDAKMADHLPAVGTTAE